MADVDSSNSQSLAKDYLLEEKIQQAQGAANSVEESVVKPAAEAAEEVVQKVEETISKADTASAEKAVEVSDGDGEEIKDSTPDDATETENTVAEEADETPEIKLETAPADYRFPTTNQTRHCFTRYIEYHRCVAVKGEDAPECDKFAKYYRSLCPSEWVERWNEQRENGTFPGPL